MEEKVKSPAELAEAIWEFNGKKYCQVTSASDDAPGGYSAYAIEEGATPDENGDYRCVELFFSLTPDNRLDTVERAPKVPGKFNGVSGHLADDFLDPMTVDDFEYLVIGCDSYEADVMGNSELGGSDFTFDCDMKGPHGRVVASGSMQVDDDGIITGVDYVTIRDVDGCDCYEDADEIDSPDEVGEILEKLARRFTHEECYWDDDDDDDGTSPSNFGGVWTL